MQHAIVLLLAAASAGCGANAHPAGEGDDDIGSGGEGEPERPSDSPEADEWIDTDPSALGEGDPCCELVGVPIQMDDEELSGGVPDVAWSGAGWGVLWGDSQGGLTFRSLDPLATPRTEPIALDGNGSGYVGIASGDGRFGIVGSARRSDSGSVGVIDDTGVLLAGMSGLGGEVGDPDIARDAHGHGWIEVHLSRGEGRTAYEAVWMDDQAVTGEPVRIETTGDSVGGSPRVVVLGSVASFVWASAGSVWSRSFAWSDAADAPAAWPMFQMSTTEDTMVALAAYRDLVAVAAIDGAVIVSLYDPWTNELVAGPSVVAEPADYDAGGAGIAAAEELGYLGVCYPTRGPGSDEEDPAGLELVLVGPEADRWGEAVTIASGQRNIGGCAVAWSGREFLVAWWQAGADAAFNKIFVQRVAPGI